MKSEVNDDTLCHSSPSVLLEQDLISLYCPAEAIDCIQLLSIKDETTRSKLTFLAVTEGKGIRSPPHLH